VKKYPLHPFLLTAYAVIALYANNAQEITVDAMLRPIVACLVLTFLGLLLFRLLTGDWVKAGVITSFLVLLFYSYGHLYQVLRNNPILGINLGRHSILGIVYILILVIGLLFLLRRKFISGDFTLMLNVITIVLIALPIIIILRYELRSSRPVGGNQQVDAALSEWQASIRAQSKQSLQKENEDSLPDIYVIVLDMYGRQDALLADLGFDNSDFLDELENLGFVVADCSRSNYAQTRLSLASFLNMQYIPEAETNISIDDVLEQGIKHSLVREQLSTLGYELTAFENGFGFSEIPDADHYYAIQPASFFDLRFQPFEAMLVKTTMLRLPIDLHPQTLSQLLSTITFPYGQHVSRVENTLTNLSTLPEVVGLKFVYAHLMIPHPPYIYEADGSIRLDDRYYREALNQPISEEYYQDGYVKNLEYTNAVMLPLIKTLIQESQTPPVIILLSDHGMRDENRMENLIAVFDPKLGVGEIYSTITPVNIFRVLLNTHFGTDYPFLEDKSYYSEYPDRYLLNEVKENSPACQP
jgi:hypothetical protein